MDAGETGWPLCVAELLTLCKRGLRPSKVQPEEISRILSNSEIRSVDQLQSALLQLPPPQSIIRFELEVPTPLWRLSAVAPMIATHVGGSLLCCLRVALPLKYPLVSLLTGRGGRVDVNSPGVLGKHAANILTQSARNKLSELHGHGVAEQIILLVDWLQDTEMHELTAASFQASTSGAITSGHVRAFVRFHHVLCVMKQSYMRMWAEDLGVAALLAAGQPAMLLVEGPRSSVSAFVDRATKVMHWGPTPARLVYSMPVYKGPDKSLHLGLTDVKDMFPNVIAPNGTYNGRDSVDYSGLACSLREAGHVGAAEALKSLSGNAFAHVKGRVRENPNGGGWIGYCSPEPELSQGGDQIELPRPAVVERHARDVALDHFDTDQDDFDVDLSEAIRRSLEGPAVVDLTTDMNAVAMDEEDPDLAEAIRLSLESRDTSGTI